MSEETTGDPSGGVTQFRYDAAGNIEEIETATGEIEQNTYDQMNRAIQVDNPIIGITQTTYDANGNVETRADPLNKTTSFEYDAADQLVKTIDPLSGETVFTYDDQGNLESVTDARGKTTFLFFDLRHRLFFIDDTFFNSIRFDYDKLDNIIKVTDRKGQVIDRIYDDLSRLTRISTLDNVTDLTYDAAGNLLTVTDNDSALTFTYDGNNRRLTAATDAAGIQPVVTLTDTYNAVGNRVSLADTLGGLTQFGFDGARRLIQLITPANDTIDVTRDLAGRPDLITFPNTLTTDFQYDLQGRLSDLAFIRGITDLARFGYTHNAAGNITSITELAQTRNFTYDDLQRLITGGTVALPESYDYDPVGNRTVSHLSASHVTDDANRLTEDDSFCYAYDANGNLTDKTAKVVGACTGGVTAYGYDIGNKLTQIDFPDLTVATYRYDGLARRIEKDVDGVITRYVYDREDILLEYDGTNTLLARYTHGAGADDPLVMQRDLDASGTFEAAERFFYHADGSGSITELTDSTGVVARAYAYDAYGQIADEIGTLANPYAYTGREFDAESGLYFYRARYYDPETGRFLSEDPIHFAGLDVNLYRYVFNNPVNLTDPTGQILPAIIGAGCIAGAIGGVIGGFDGTVVGAITAITISEAQSGGGGGGGSSNDGCGDADSTEPPPAIPTPTPGDFLRNAAFDAFLGCLAGGLAVIALNPATVFTAAAIASSVGVTEGFIIGFVGQIKQLF